MPTSQHKQISAIVAAIMSVAPKTVLDIGIGFGKYGFLCREYLELWDGRNRYGSNTRIIDGIEIHEKYVTPLQRAIYNNIYIGHANNVLDGMLGRVYDLALLIDVIEHLDTKGGQELLSNIARHARAAIISTPKEVSMQGTVFGNKYETHRSQWSEDDFAGYKNKVLIPDCESLIYLINFRSSNGEDSISSDIPAVHQAP